MTKSTLTVPISFTEEENAALHTAVSLALLRLEETGGFGVLKPDKMWTVLNSLQTLFAENGYAFQKQRQRQPDGG